MKTFSAKKGRRATFRKAVSNDTPRTSELGLSPDTAHQFKKFRL